NSRSLEYLALKTMREGFHGRVTASHCGAMAGYNDVYAAKIIDMVATANVTISVNTHINLVCSARLDREPKRRGIARVKEVLARGVNDVSSQDHVDDPYYPFGKPDQLEVALMMAAHRPIDAAPRARTSLRHGDRECGTRGAIGRLWDRARQQSRPGRSRRPVRAPSTAPAAAAPARDQERGRNRAPPRDARAARAMRRAAPALLFLSDPTRTWPAAKGPEIPRRKSLLRTDAVLSSDVRREWEEARCSE